mgnify:CR=1 FL=1|tara:strand:+ start:140745 stop:141563 length:819 start_codon:yes stop_codon:yes gene_type:complete
MLISVICFAFANIFVKAHPEIPFYQWAFFRAGFILIFAYGFMKAKGISALGNNRPLLVTRGIFGTIGIILYFYTVQNTSLGTATTIQYLSPLFAVFIALYFFKEPLNRNNFVAFLLAICGVIVMKYSDITLTGKVTSIGVFAAVCSAIAYNCIRQLKSTDHPMTVVFYFPLVTFPVTGVFVLNHWVTPDITGWIHVLIFCALNMLAQYLMTISYQENQVKTVSIVKYVGVIISFVIGWVGFNEPVTLSMSVGVLLILGALYLNKPQKPAKTP